MEFIHIYIWLDNIIIIMRGFIIIIIRYSMCGITLRAFIQFNYKILTFQY